MKQPYEKESRLLGYAVAGMFGALSAIAVALIFGRYTWIVLAASLATCVIVAIVRSARDLPDKELVRRESELAKTRGEWPAPPEREE